MSDLVAARTRVQAKSHSAKAIVPRAALLGLSERVSLPSRAGNTVKYEPGESHLNACLTPMWPDLSSSQMSANANFSGLRPESVETGVTRTSGCAKATIPLSASKTLTYPGGAASAGAEQHTQGKATTHANRFIDCSLPRVKKPVQLVTARPAKNRASSLRVVEQHGQVVVLYCREARSCHVVAQVPHAQPFEQALDRR